VNVCAQCRYHTQFRSDARCMNPSAPNYTGSGANCYALRMSHQHCGPAGVWFAEKPVAQRNREALFALIWLIAITCLISAAVWELVQG
jgi:hypothetical protein